MRRIVTEKKLAAYAVAYPHAAASLETWRRLVRLADWKTPSDIRGEFNDVDPVRVASGNTVYVFNIQHNEHRLIAAIHFNTSMVFVLRIMTHREYDKNRWKREL